MTIEIAVGNRNIMFRLDWKHWRWHSLDEPEEAAFPLSTVINAKRYDCIRMERSPRWRSEQAFFGRP